MGILFGLGAALGWGVADYMARFASRQIGNFRTLFYMQLLALAGLSGFLWLKPPTGWDWPLAGLTVLLAVGNTLAGLSLYRAFEVGLLSVVSPITASYGAVTLALGLLTGQQPSLLALAGLAITIIGVMLASTPLRWNRNPAPIKSGAGLNRGVGLALLASGLFGVVFWGLGYVIPRLGGVVPVWEMRLIAPFVIAGLAGPRRINLSLPGRSTWGLLVGVAACDTAALLLFNFGLENAESGLVSVISSLFSAVTVLLARVFLREKLAANQWLGVLLILAGVGLVSAG